MKVLLLGFFTRTYMPYIEKYEDVLKKNNIEYDVIFFDRDSTSKEIMHQANEYTFCHKTTASRMKKIIPVIMYSKFVKKMMREGDYDRIIVFTTMPAILCKRILCKKYKGKYIYDYRDTTYEKFPFFKRWVDEIIDKSAFTAMSSKGYMNVLADNKKIVFNHNVSNIDDRVSYAKGFDKRITIGFLGYVRYFDVNSRLIESLRNSERYDLVYIGTQFSDCDLGSYAKEICADNVTIIGKYNNSDKGQLYSGIGIINSMYSLNSGEVQYAIPNRLYDAALFKIPLLTSKGTYLSEITEKYGLGFSVDPFTDDLKEEIDKYVDQFDVKTFDNNCEKFLAEVLEEEGLLKSMIEEFVDDK